MGWRTPTRELSRSLAMSSRSLVVIVYCYSTRGSLAMRALDRGLGQHLGKFRVCDRGAGNPDDSTDVSSELKPLLLKMGWTFFSEIQEKHKPIFRSEVPSLNPY
jgi:hypothetical protein